MTRTPRSTEPRAGIGDPFVMAGRSRRTISMCAGVSLAVFGAAAGCQTEVRGTDFGEAGTSTATTEAGDASTGSEGGSVTPMGSGDSQAGTAGDESSSGPGGPGIKLDVAPDDDPPTGPGCSKIDFLFVVDNSGSMEDEQQNLIASFPEFFSTIVGEVEADDFHLMVVTTDGSMMSGGGGGSQVISCSAGNCTCEPTPDCCEDACALGGALTCYGVPCGQTASLEQCDVTEGAGRRFGQGQPCDFESYPRFITGADSNVEAAFACASDVGTYGSGNEIPMATMLAATSPELGESGACNEGFLRDDAVLVVTFITDEEDDFVDGPVPFGSPGDPQSWHADLLANKGGQENAIVVLGLFGDTGEPGSICEPLETDGVDGAEAAPRLRAFVDAFGDHGFTGSVCAADYGPFFEEAVSIIDTTCDEYEPAG